METYKSRIEELERLVDELKIKIRALESENKVNPITPTQGTIVNFMLRKEKITQKQIIEELQIPQSTVSHSLKNLVHEGYIKEVHVRNPHHRIEYELVDVPPELR